MDLYAKAHRKEPGRFDKPLGPFKYLVIFVVDTGAQMSAFQTEVAALVDYARQGKELGM